MAFLSVLLMWCILMVLLVVVVGVLSLLGGLLLTVGAGIALLLGWRHYRRHRRKTGLERINR